MDLFSDFSWWKTIFWLVTTLGVAGTIALAVFFPAVAKMALDAVVRLLAFVLSYRVGCALVAAVLAALVADYWRHSTEDAKHAAEVAAFEQAQVDRDKRIAIETREEVWKEIANATAENAETDKTVKDFTDALPHPPETGNPFAVGADACRLRALAGQAGCGSGGAKGVPQADTGRASIRDRIRKRLSGGGGGSPGRAQQGQ